MSGKKLEYPISLSTIFLLLVTAVGCSLGGGSQDAAISQQTTGTEISSQASPVSSVITQSQQPAATSTKLPALTPVPTSTTTPVPDLLTCPDPELSQGNLSHPVKLLYTNSDQVWMWDEISRDKTLVSLPPDAVAPHLSPDGRYAAYLIAGQSFDSLEKPVSEIPLWLYDLQNGQASQAASFAISEARQQNPESPHIYLKLSWLENNHQFQPDHWLLVEVNSEPWTETGCCPPRGDLYLVKAETGETKLILPGDAYTFYSFHPNGTQIAALNINGEMRMIDIPSGESLQTFLIQLPENPWLVFAPLYSPNGENMALQDTQGLLVIDSEDGSMRSLAIENPCQDCYWGPRLPIVWHPDGKMLFTTTSLDDSFDQSAKTMLVEVNLEPEMELETSVAIQANPFTLNFSPNFKYLSYWNQPDWDSAEASEEKMNWVILYQMDMTSQKSILYEQQYGLRMSSWSPDNQHFLYTYSSVGGANLDRKMFALGNVCQPSAQLPVPNGMIIDETRWLDSARFLAWTLPEEGIPDQYESGLYLYGLAGDHTPIYIDGITVHQTEPYGVSQQVVVLEPQP